MNFLSYAVQRLLAGIGVVFFATLLTFLFMRLAPGDFALLLIAGPNAQGTVDPAIVEATRQALGLNRPLLIQFADFISDFVRGDWGNSLWTRRPLVDELAARIPVTVEIALLSEFTAWLIALPLGIASAVRRGGLIDGLVRLLTTIGLSVPIFWFATLLLLALVLWFDWIPPLGMRPFREQPIAHLQQIALPILSLGFVLSASLARLIRSEILEVLSEPFVQTARAKGLKESSVLRRHVLRNALLAPLTFSGVRLASLLGGVIFVEVVFNIPGLGRFLIDAVLRRDYPAVQIIVALQAAIFVIINFLVDISYLFVDPRLRHQAR